MKAPRTFATRQEGRDWLTTEHAKILSGGWNSPNAGRIAFSELANQWLNSNPAKRASTFARDEIVVRCHLSPVFGPRSIASIKQAEVQEAVNAWTKASSARTVKRQYGVLKAIFNYAVELDLIGRSPCRMVNLPEVSSRTRPAMNPAQVAHLAEGMAKSYGLMVWIGAVLGLRWGEVAGLSVGDIDLEQQTISVTQQVARGVGGKSVLGPPKSQNGRRVMAMPKQLCEMIEAHLFDLGIHPDDRGALLFTNAEGGLLAYSNFRRRTWLPATNAAGLDGYGFHDLRRASTTALVSEGVDVKTAMVRLGHSDPRLTLMTYAQVTTEADRFAAERLGERFFPMVS